ncbi:MAG TPA: hypothetical protein VFY83_00270 [Anaerolineales bacterium]|nr:hypothetical protein [Anaerolineales bacterium]
MQYKYAREQLDFSDLSSGRVFYSLAGHPAFPVRLASEIFQRCVAQRERMYQVSTPCTLYDPCCGAAYHLSVLAYLHREHIREVIASDLDEKAIALAERNLGLLHLDGLDKRILELSNMLEKYGKDSHREALRSASVLKEKLLAFTARPALETRIFQASATDRNTISKHIQPKLVDILFTDVPYGRHSQWRDSGGRTSPNLLWSMLDSVHDLLSSSGIVAVASDKQQKAAHERFQRIEHFQVGKRRIVILRPI